MRLVIAVLVCAWIGLASAASQLPDKLILDGRAESLLASPLQPALESDPQLHGRLKRYFSKKPCAELERGYLATWEVREGALFLVKLDVDACGSGKAVPLSLLFPGASGPVKASWFTGELKTQREKQAPGSRNLILYVKQGAVTGTLTLEREQGKK
jgi:hypothetical protein